MQLHAGANAALSAQAIELLAALAQKQRLPVGGAEQGAAALLHRHQQPVAIIGPGDGSLQECEAAYAIAACLVKAGMTIVCGGRGGVMQAASQGATQAGGIAIGLLPEEDCRGANPYLTVAIPTGMGEMRNALIARSAVCLVAVGGGMGTVSEMAMGLKWGKSVFTLHAEVQLPGAKAADSISELLEWVAAELLKNEP